MNDLVIKNQLDRARTILTNPQSFEQVKGIADMASGLHKALKNVRNKEAAYYDAFEIMVLSYITIGKELAGMEKAHGARPPDGVPEGNPVATLSDLNISKKQSFEWQTMALVPWERVEQYIAGNKQEEEPVTKIDIINMGKSYKTEDQLCLEKVRDVTLAIASYHTKVKTLLEHLQNHPNSRKVVLKEIFDQLNLVEEITDLLNRSLM
jgi:hypothetical protein